MLKMYNNQVPSEKTIDNTFSLMQEGYLFTKNLSEEFQSDIFETRLLGEKVICMTGYEASKLFYDTNKFERKNAAPKRIQKTLFGENAIQGMDGAAHLHRKQLFMSLMDKPNQDMLSKLVLDKWISNSSVYENSEKIIIFDEAKNILCQMACKWVGVPLSDEDMADKADEFAAMVDSFGSVGPRHWKGRKARNNNEYWMQEIISKARNGKLSSEEGTALHAMAFYKDIDGNLLDEKMAAIELINVIRPIVAISTYIAFMALALYDNPKCKERLIKDDDKYLEIILFTLKNIHTRIICKKLNIICFT